MATRDVFSAEELDQLRASPEINRAELIRHFTLTPADEAFLRRFRRPSNVFGAAVQMCTLPWLGFVPDEVAAVPPAAVARLSERLVIPVAELDAYAQREQTRTDHLREIAAYLGWRSMDELLWKEVDESLFSRAMEHDSPRLLFRLGCEYLMSSRVIRPGVVWLLEHVATARAAANAATWQRLAHLATPQRRVEMDGLLVVDPSLGLTRLHWLSRGPEPASPAAVKTELEKLTFLRRLDAHELDRPQPDRLAAGPGLHRSVPIGRRTRPAEAVFPGHRRWRPAHPHRRLPRRVRRHRRARHPPDAIRDAQRRRRTRTLLAQDVIGAAPPTPETLMC